ncbi:MAG: hypothetical protein ACKO14_11310, partial [Armatimonadota bacterium]
VPGCLRLFRELVLPLHPYAVLFDALGVRTAGGAIWVTERVPAGAEGLRCLLGTTLIADHTMETCLCHPGPCNTYAAAFKWASCNRHMPVNVDQRSNEPICMRCQS